MTYAQGTVLPSAARTTSGDGAAVGGFGDAETLRAQLDVTAVSGVTPSLTVKLQDSLDGVNWNDLGPFAAKTAVGREVIDIATPHGSLLRATWTITGTTPSFTFAVIVVGQ